HMITTRTGIDHSAVMRRYAKRRVAQLATADLSGYVLKKNSPSCGLERVKVFHRRKPSPSPVGRGLFADALVQAFPHLPMEEEGRLSDPDRRENFIERVFAYHRLTGFFRARWTVGHLLTFHHAHELQLQAHALGIYAKLGQLIADAGSRSRAEFRNR